MAKKGVTTNWFTRFLCFIGLHYCNESLPRDPAESLHRDIILTCKRCGVRRQMVGWKYGHSSVSIEDYYPYMETLREGE